MSKKTKLYQVFRQDLNDESFCFNAKNDQDAEYKFFGWLNRHGFTQQSMPALVRKVDAPKYENNIHNDWVW